MHSMSDASVAVGTVATGTGSAQRSFPAHPSSQITKVHAMRADTPPLVGTATVTDADKSPRNAEPNPQAQFTAHLASKAARVVEAHLDTTRYTVGETEPLTSDEEKASASLRGAAKDAEGGAGFSDLEAQLREEDSKIDAMDRELLEEDSGDGRRSSTAVAGSSRPHGAAAAGGEPRRSASRRSRRDPRK